jgi:hypothetical protein
VDVNDRRLTALLLVAEYSCKMNKFDETDKCSNFRWDINLPTSLLQHSSDMNFENKMKVVGAADKVTCSNLLEHWDTCLPTVNAGCRDDTEDP